MLVVGKVKTIGVYPQSALRADYFKPPELLDVTVYQCIPTHIIFCQVVASCQQHAARTPKCVGSGGVLHASSRGITFVMASCTAPTVWTAASWTSICDECVCASSIEPSWVDHRDGPGADC
uniref:Uncharacterized protein n=1 Tax=Haptolina brevifila TaxID=156173 RepID=A0A7S2GLD4_9EUKA